MIPALYIGYVFCASFQSALTKHGGRRGADPFSFNLFKAIGAALVFSLLLLLLDRDMHLPTIVYGAVYGIFASVSMYTGLMGLAIGPMALTSMIASFSLIIPTAYGMAVLDERMGIVGIVGLCLLCVAMVLFGAKRKDKPLSLKWWFFSLMTLLSNGIGSIVQKEHQIAYPSLHRFQFMASAMITASVMIVIVLLFKSRASCVKESTGTAAINGGSEENIRKNAFGAVIIVLATLSGVLNGGANYLSLHLCSLVNASVLYPVLSGATGCATWLIGRLVFKEKLSILQTAGFVIGVVSVVLLNL